MARVGVLIGSDSAGTFFVTPQPRTKMIFADSTPSGFHTIKAVGVPGTQDFEWFVDGVSQGSARITDQLITSSEATQVNFQAGSSASLNGAMDWKRVSLKELKEASVVIDSDSLTITDGGVESGDTFRGILFTATVYNGLARFLFAGDLEFMPTDFVRGKGSAAISLTVSGDVVIPEGAVIDVSASVVGAGPGGGGMEAAGGGPGDGKGGGGSVTGGAGGLGGQVSFTRVRPGENGDPGKWGNFGIVGEDDDDGSRGNVGRSGYRSPGKAGGLKPLAGTGGPGGTRGSRSTGAGTAGSGGPASQGIRRPDGTAGGNATANGGGGGPGQAGGEGASGHGGNIVRGIPGLTGGSGGASGQERGGGGGVAPGRVVVLSDTGSFAGEILQDEGIVLANYEGQREINSHLSNFESTPLIPDLLVGAEVAGIDG